MAVIALLILFFWLRRRRNSARYAPTSPVDLTAGEYSPGYTDKSQPTVYSEVPSASPLTTTEYSHPIPPPIPSPKVYVSGCHDARAIALLMRSPGSR